MMPQEFSGSEDSQQKFRAKSVLKPQKFAVKNVAMARKFVVIFVNACYIEEKLND